MTVGALSHSPQLKGNVCLGYVERNAPERAAVRGALDHGGGAWLEQGEGLTHARGAGNEKV